MWRSKTSGSLSFSKDERIVSAVKAAGGLTKKASAESINQAEKMKTAADNDSVKETDSEE